MANGILLDTAPLRTSGAFARLWAGQAVAGIGGQMTIVAVGLHIYELTRSTLAVSIVGVLALLPTVVAGLYGGALADAFDRRTVALAAAVASWLSTGAIATLAWLGLETVGSLYALTAVTAAASTVLGAAEMSITPRLLPLSLLPAAAALGGISSGIAVTVGPALAGVLVAVAGFQWTYTVDVVLFVAALAGVATLPSLVPEGATGRPGLRDLLGGIAFLRDAPNVRMGFLVDIAAMVFGQPRVLFPAAGALVLGGGAITVGILTAAYAAGALLCGLFSGPLGGVRAQGRAIGRAVEAYGVFIAGFGVVLGLAMLGGGSSSAAPQPLPTIAAAVFLAAAGAADNVSAVFRSTMLQAAVPDAFRGRLQGVFIVVVTGGPRLGDLYAGVVATLAVLWLPPVLGGVLLAALVALMVRRSRTFRDYDALTPTP